MKQYSNQNKWNFGNSVFLLQVSWLEHCSSTVWYLRMWSQILPGKTTDGQFVIEKDIPNSESTHKTDYNNVRFLTLHYAILNF